MNKHTEQLMQYPPHILKSRVIALRAELDRAREARPTKLFAVFAVLLSLVSLGLSSGFTSLPFVLSAIVIALIIVVQGIGAWGLWSNLRDSTNALEQVTR